MIRNRKWGLFWNFHELSAPWMKTYIFSWLGRLIWGIFDWVSCNLIMSNLCTCSGATTREVASKQSSKADTQMTIIAFHCTIFSLEEELRASRFFKVVKKCIRYRILSDYPPIIRLSQANEKPTIVHVRCTYATQLLQVHNLQLSMRIHLKRPNWITIYRLQLTQTSIWVLLLLLLLVFSKLNFIIKQNNNFRFSIFMLEKLLIK